jgi:lycopene beta-cyclase
MKHYHYIFTGSGLAFNDSLKWLNLGSLEKTILLLEKKTNDRTWCFWQIEKGDWEPSISKKWSSTLTN